MKQPKLLIIFLFLVGFAMPLKAQVKKLQVQINSSTDDAEERGRNATSGVGTMDITSSDLELMKDGNNGDQFMGLRFNAISIPPNSKIVNAYIQFAVDEFVNNPGSVVLKVEDTDNSSTFTTTTFDISSRKVMKDSVIWSSIPDWTVEHQANEDQRTPDLASLVQMIVNRSGWKSGNSLNFILTGTGVRIAEAFDGTAAVAPVLVVNYIETVTQTFTILSGNDDAENDVNAGTMDITSTDLEFTTDGTEIQLVGLRFDQLSIPQGAEILSAYLQFTVDEVNSTGDVDVLISVENSDNASGITSSANNLATRSFTDSIIWNNIAGWNTVGDAGAAQRSPDLTPLIQKIVNRPGWQKGNALLFGLVDPAVVGVTGYSGNASKRVAQTYELNTANAAKLVVRYAPPAVYQKGTFPIAKGSSWKYNDQGKDLGTSWVDSSYNDANWNFGNGEFGYGDSKEKTTLSFGANSSAKHPTYYFRNTFDVSDPSPYDSLVFKTLRDDGVIVYVNGTEAFRMNMPSTSNYNTYASSAVADTNELIYFKTKTANLLKKGENVIAVELHQASASSSDLAFDMEAGFTLPPLKPTTYPLVKNTEWNYLDDGSDLFSTNWTDTSYNDDTWSFGKAPLGYGDAMNTTISFGSDANNKIITYYFRRDIDINLATMPDTLEFGVRRDDGIRIFVNGKEIIRDNLPTDTIMHTTLAPTTIDGTNETTFYTWKFPKTVFHNGVNAIAAELHNRDVFSSDLGFDMYIEEYFPPNPPALGCANGNENHIACFTSIGPKSQTQFIDIPDASHGFQMIFKQGETYTNSAGNVPGNHDFTAYIPLNGSSTKGHLAINHENTPGAVSILDLHYDTKARLWVVDSTRAVNFTNSDLVGTSRNCSGGITPWGTIITAEETSSAGDANSDGYTDMGWLIEIDPVTAKVKEYGNGKQEKLWACGRNSHENAVVLNDSITLYTGEDGGTSVVYKFVADKKADLSSGTLYGLQLDGPLSGGDPTVSTGKWITIPNTTQAERNSTSSLAGSLGATNFNGVEDIEIGTIDGKMYFTSKGLNRVYRFTDNGLTLSNFETFVGGTSYELNTEVGVVTTPWGSGNDNLTFDDKGNLWVLQDGSNNYIWMVRPNHTQDKPKVELFMSPPTGSEPTGLTFTPDYKFGFLSIQHPSSTNGVQKDASLKDIRFNASATIVIARKENLGPQAPVAKFNADKRLVVAGASTTFSDMSEDAANRMWIFNGGVPAVSYNENVTVTYPGKGMYTVELRVFNAVGTDTLVQVGYVEVIDPSPVVRFMASEKVVAEGDTVYFNDLSSNDPTSWKWTFEGGTPATSILKNPVVIYNTKGTFNVTLEATNRAGNNAMVSQDFITVKSTLGLLEYKINQNLNVYPNPSKGQLNIEFTAETGKKVKISAYDLMGRELAVIANEMATGSMQHWSTDLNQYSQGATTLIIKIEVDGAVVQRLIQRL